MVISGVRTREERDAELRKRAIDLEAESPLLTDGWRRKRPKLEHSK